jgi:hypothetical protein
MTNHPSIPPREDVITIARGEARLAFEHSSLRWNGASYPLIVQITPRNDIRTAKPSGHCVPLVNVPQTSLDLFVFGVLIDAVGITMKKMNRANRLMQVPTWLNLARKRVWNDAIMALRNKIRQVRRYVCQCCGT